MFVVCGSSILLNVLIKFISSVVMSVLCIELMLLIIIIIKYMMSIDEFMLGYMLDIGVVIMFVIVVRFMFNVNMVVWISLMFMFRDLVMLWLKVLVWIFMFKWVLEISRYSVIVSVMYMFEMNSW